MSRPHIAVIDPAVNVPELECFNNMALLSPLPLTYHLPCRQGMQSLRAENLSQLKGIVILGSAASVHERKPWMIELETWLMPRLEARIPTFGFCYGHQMLAYMFGGDVGYVSLDRTKLKGFREVQVNATPLWKSGVGKICVSHNEEVKNAPACMEVIAKSAQIAIDGLAHKQLPVFSLQSHPEAVAEFLTSHEIPAGENDPFAYGYELVKGFLKFAGSYQR